MFKSKKDKPSFAKRFLRSAVSITILSAFVIILSIFVKALSSLNKQSFVSLTSPIANKLGLSKDDVGEVAGEFAQRVSETKINPKNTVNALDNSKTSSEDENENIEQALFKIALLADSHNANGNLKQAVEQINNEGIRYMVYLGDLTDWGDIASLKKAQEILNTFKHAYFVLPGDHDLAQSVGLDNFLTVFESPNTILTLGDYKFVLFDNSANYTPITEGNMHWLLLNIKDADFVILSQPLYHPINTRIMGIVDYEVVKDVKEQADVILNAIRVSNVEAVISADQHQSSISIDPERESLKHIVVGALVSERNYQTPRYSILNLFEDNSYTIEDIILE